MTGPISYVRIEHPGASCDDELWLMRALALAVPVPRTEVLDDHLALRTWATPFVIKPRRHEHGHSRVVETGEDLRVLPRDGSFVLQEYLPGEEFLVHVEASATGVIQSVARRLARAMRGGEPTRTVRDTMLELLTARVVEQLALEGTSSLRFKRDRFGQPRLFRVTPLRLAI